MKSNIILSALCLLFCMVSASCRSSGGNADVSVVPSFQEIEGCSLSIPCMILTPETLENVPGPVVEAAKDYCGKSGTVVVASALRPRYLRLIREQGRLLLGSVEVNPSREIVYLCVLTGLGDEADSVRSVKVENPDSPAPWDLGVFIKRYPELAARLNELPPEDSRLAAAEPAVRELLSRGSTRAMLEKHSRGADADALDDAMRAEQEQIRVVEAILNQE